jgi:hypothetical protein
MVEMVEMVETVERERHTHTEMVETHTRTHADSQPDTGALKGVSITHVVVWGCGCHDDVGFAARSHHTAAGASGKRPQAAWQARSHAHGQPMHGHRVRRNASERRGEKMRRGNRPRGNYLNIFYSSN